MRGARSLGAALVAGAVLLVAGCGGNEEVSQSTRWAGDLCTAVGTWRTSMESIAESLRADPTRQNLQDAADEGLAETRALIETVRGLGDPGTESGQRAQSAIESLADSLESGVETIRKAVDDVSGPQDLLTAVSTVSTTVGQVSAEVSATVEELEALQDVDNELKQSFADAESCDGVVPAAP